MFTTLKQYTGDHRYLLDLAARQAGFTSPLAIDLDEFSEPLLRAARRGELLPVDGLLVRDWTPDCRRWSLGAQLGMRLYEIEGVRFVQMHVPFIDEYGARPGLSFTVVDRKDYRRLYKIALRCRRDSEPPSHPPVLPSEQADLLWKNTIGYLDRKNLRRIKAYGGRARRGVLLTGTPGNGKTMACRWIWEECRWRGWEWRLVTPDTYKAARHSCNPQEEVKALFEFDRSGIVFFDDMDLALRDRQVAAETDDQAVFLGALDGISVNEGVVFVFTTNCSLDLIDNAFKRPGRLDLVLHFKAPDARLRRELMDRWHTDIKACLDLDAAVASTDGYSFAEIEELKNLLVMRFMDTDEWDWSWALKQFADNRDDLGARRRPLGFASAVANGNGLANSC
jgi:cell division protease FtsH